jgi:hypothetical protein
MIWLSLFGRFGIMGVDNFDDEVHTGKKRDSGTGTQLEL